MGKNYKIELFVSLGEQFRKRLANGKMDAVIAESVAANSWFTDDNVRYAIDALCSDMLTETVLTRWMRPYGERYTMPVLREVGVVTAGNIPLVGFFDLMCVLICGHTCVVKPSSKDRVLTEYTVNLLRQIDPGLPLRVVDDLENPEAVIATGSDNTNRYFRTRYDGIPALFRGSRISTAVLTGRETPEELSGLWDDMFRYFGLGCRNVSRLFVPQNYDVGQLAAALSRRPLTLAKYVHGYRQARALNLLSGTAFTDGGFFMLRETGEQGHTLGEISYTRYSDFAEVSRWLEDNDEKVQCVVTSALPHSRRAGFGYAQHPRPEDYPDGADVIDFLHRI